MCNSYNSKLKRVTGMEFRNKKVLIVAHRDGDGIASAALFSIMLKKLGNFPTITSPEYAEFDENVKSIIKKTNPEILVCLDIPTRNLKNVGVKTLAIDHHPPKTKKGIELIYDENHCTSYLTYNYCNKITNIEDASWIAAVGCLSDKDFNGLKEMKKIYSKFYEIKDKELQRMVNLISSSKMLGEMGMKYGVNALIEAYNISIPSTIFGSTLNSQKLLKSRKISEKERNYWLLFHQNFVRREGKVLYYPIQSKFPVESYIAGTLSNLYPNLICIVGNFKKDFIIMEGRTKLNLNLGKIFMEASKKVGGNGGGLKNAAGARIPKMEEMNFLKEVKKII